MAAAAQAPDESLARTFVPAGTVHHVGFVVASIEGTIRQFAESIGATWDGIVFQDPLQHVRVAFVRGANPADPLIELVEPDGDRSPVGRFLERGGGLHHMCFETPQLERQLADSRARGCIVTSPPQPAVAFDGRRIAWVYTRQRLLIEYLERTA